MSVIITVPLENNAKTDYYSYVMWKGNTYSSTRWTAAVNFVSLRLHIGLLPFTKITKQPSRATTRFTQDSWLSLSKQIKELEISKLVNQLHHSNKKKNKARNWIAGCKSQDVTIQYLKTTITVSISADNINRKRPADLKVSPLRNEAVKVRGGFRI